MSSIGSSSSGESLSSGSNISPEVLEKKVQETAYLLNAIVNLKPGFMLVMDEKTEVHAVKMKKFFGKGIRLQNNELMSSNLKEIIEKVKANLKEINSQPISLIQCGTFLKASSDLRRALSGEKSAVGQVSSSMLKIALRPEGVKDWSVRKYLKESNSRVDMLNELVHQELSYIKRPPMQPT